MIRTDVEINEAPFETYPSMRVRTLLERHDRRQHRQISPADEREPLERPHKPRCCKPVYGGVKPHRRSWVRALYGSEYHPFEVAR